MISRDTIDAISEEARRHGFDPADWLAIAERESSMNPNARAGTSSAHGLFQMLAANRARYGHGASAREQAQAYGGFASDLRNEMARHLGRNPTGEELYTGHYWGGSRAARMISGRIHPETPVSDVFTPNELAANPSLARHGSVGRLLGATMGDISRRRARWGGAGGEDLSGFGEAGEAAADLGEFGEHEPAPAAAGSGALGAPSAPADLSGFGGQQPPARQKVSALQPPPTAPAARTAPVVPEHAPGWFERPATMQEERYHREIDDAGKPRTPVMPERAYETIYDTIDDLKIQEQRNRKREQQPQPEYFLDPTGHQGLQDPESGLRWNQRS